MPSLLLALLFTFPIEVLDQPRGEGERAASLRPMSSSGRVDWNIPGVPTFSCSFDQAAGTTITPEIGGFNFTKTGTVTRVTDGTWPSGIDGSQGYAHRIQSNNYWYATDANCSAALEPAGSFSACVIFSADYYPGANNFLFSKYTSAGNQRTWYLYATNAGDLYLRVSDDGASTTTGPGIAGGYPLFSQVFICVAYTYSAPGAVNTATIWSNGSSATTNNSEGPPFNSNGDCIIGAPSSGAAGRVHHAVFWNNVVMTTAQYNQMFTQWRGTSNTFQSPLSVVSVSPYSTMRATSDSGTEPFMTGNVPGSNRVGVYGGYFGGPYVNLVHRGGFESVSSGEPLGWTVVETPGTGTSAIDAATNTRAEGFRSVQTVLTGTDSVGALKSGCNTAGIGADFYASVYAKKSIGTSISNLYIEQFTAANNCTGAQTDTNITAPANLATTWAAIGNRYPAASWAGGTQSWRLVWQETCDGGCTSYVDAAMGLSSSWPTDAGCFCDSDLDCTCSMAAASYEKTPITVGSWTVSMKVRSRITDSAATVRYLIRDNGTSGDNNAVIGYLSNSVATFDCYDSAGVLKTKTVAAAYTVNTEHTAVFQHTAGGDFRVCWDGTCSAWQTGCIRNGNGTFRIGNDGSTAGSELWIRDTRITQRVVGP